MVPGVILTMFGTPFERLWLKYGHFRPKYGAKAILCWEVQIRSKSMVSGMDPWGQQVMHKWSRGWCAPPAGPLVLQHPERPFEHLVSRYLPGPRYYAL